MNDSIGAAMRKLRLKKKMTLAQVSEHVGLSASFLSLMERGNSSLGIDGLTKLAALYGVEVAYFFNEERLPQEEPIIRSYEREYLQLNSKYIQYALSREMKKKRSCPEIYELCPDPNPKDKPLIWEHPRFEYVIVLEGVLSMTINHTEYTMYPYDTACIPSNVPHGWQNRTNKMVRVISFAVEEHDAGQQEHKG